MDKLSEFRKKTVASRKGFALLLTLSILAIVIGLTSTLVSYMSTARSSATATRALIQGNIFYADIQAVLKKFKSQKEVLYKILYKTPVPFELDNGRLSIMLKCEPLANSVNINWIAYGDDSKFDAQYQAVQKVFEYLAQRYNLVNINLLEEKIIARIKNQDTYDDFSDRLKSNKFILSYKDFEKILFEYSQEENDKNIIKIPWNKYFVYNIVDKDPKNNLIDGNYMSAELISVLFDMEIDIIKDEWEMGETKLGTFLNNNGVKFDKKLFVQKFYTQTQCEVYYDYMDNRFKFTFNDIDNEVKNFEFYGRQ
jgi:hypothetical protein